MAFRLYGESQFRQTKGSAMARMIVPATAEGEILVCDEGLSFWGGVHGETGVIQDAQHPQVGTALGGRIVMMPTSRGSCSGGSMLLNLVLLNTGPVALVFREDEDILTLGAVIAARMFDRNIGIIRLDPADYDRLTEQEYAVISPDRIVAGDLKIPLSAGSEVALDLSATDRAKLRGDQGPAVKLAMEILTDVAKAQGANALIDVNRAHIDGCLYAGTAFLTFAERMLDLGARVAVPTTLNAISVDFAHWRGQNVDPDFGTKASNLAAAYVKMGAKPSFTCAPYHLKDRPAKGEDVAWSESNAVIFANSVLGARTVKHPDFLDFCMAITGRAVRSGVYLDAGRVPRRVVQVTKPADADDAFWPLLGWVLGKLSSDRIPVVRGLETTSPTEDDLRALCAAFGTTSAASMLHVAGVTPEGDLTPTPDADTVSIDAKALADAWLALNFGDDKIDLVAFGSPHFSAEESRLLLNALKGRKCHEDGHTMITLGQGSLTEIEQDGTAGALRDLGVTLVPDMCWCTITKPVFPTDAKVLMTNSGKYAHYGPGLSGCDIRFGSIRECADAAVSGVAPKELPAWLAS